MSSWISIPLASQSAKAKSPHVSCERLVNCYLEQNPANAKGPVTIYSDPGLRVWSGVGYGPIRGAIMLGAHLYVVSGNGLYRVSSDKSAVLLGEIPGSGPVHLAVNATQVAIAASTGFYVATPTSLVNVNGERYSSVSYADGYGILTLHGTEQVFITATDDFTSISALDFTSADRFADLLVGGAYLGGEFVALGAASVEHYSNTGDASFPFQRTGGAALDVGCGAENSIAQRSGRLFFLGEDGAVWSLSGYQPQRISTPGLELEIRNQPDPASARGFAYAHDGHEHYALTFRSLTLVYDITTGLWRERQSFGKGRWRADCYVRAFGLDLVGDFESGGLYELAAGYLREQYRETKQFMTPGTSKIAFPQTGATDIDVELWAAGGGGGAGANDFDWGSMAAGDYGGGGGGGGAYVRAVEESPETEYEIQVGAGGAGGDAYAADEAGTHGQNGEYTTLLWDSGAKSLFAEGGYAGSSGVTSGSGGSGGQVSSTGGDMPLVIRGGGGNGASGYEEIISGHPAASWGGHGGGGGGSAGFFGSGRSAAGEHAASLAGGVAVQGGGAGGNASIIDRYGSLGIIQATPGSYPGGGGGGGSVVDGYPSTSGAKGADGKAVISYSALDPLIRTLQLPPIHAAGERAIMHELAIDLETGTVANAGGEAWETPQLMLSWSDDDGHTWSSPVQASAGKTGERQLRVTWSRLGMFRSRTLMLSISDPVGLAVVGASARIEVVSD